MIQMDYPRGLYAINRHGISSDLEEYLLSISDLAVIHLMILTPTASQTVEVRLLNWHRFIAKRM